LRFALYIAAPRLVSNATPKPKETGDPIAKHIKEVQKK